MGAASFQLVDANGLIVDGQLSFLRAYFQLLYFSVVVSTTTGYGDVVALYPSTRIAVVLHAFIAYVCSMPKLDIFGKCYRLFKMRDCIRYFVNVVVLGLGICHVVDALETKWRAQSSVLKTGRGDPSMAGLDVLMAQQEIGPDSMTAVLQQEYKRASFLA
jgi:hypothetical protein